MEQIKDNLGWLIRDTKNTIRGPYTYSEVLQLIKKGQIRGKTEVSQANSYWFAIEEKEELAKFFPELGVGGKNIQEPLESTMTGTLTKADDRKLEESDYTKVTSATAKTDPEVSGSHPEAKIEWLSEEFADEFGFNPDDETTAISTKNIEKLVGNKKDTLPSELKELKTDRPKPMNTVLKVGLEKNSSMQSSGNVITVPVAGAEKSAKIIRENTQEEVDTKNKIIVYSLVFLAFLGIAIGLAFYLTSNAKKNLAKLPVKKIESQLPIRNLIPIEAARRALLLQDLESAKDAIAKLERANSKDPILHITNGIFKKELLSDAEGANSSLKMARGLTEDARLTTEIDNLLGVYNFENDSAESIALFRSAQTKSNDIVFRYNVATALFRQEKYDEVLSTTSNITQAIVGLMAEHFYILQGWSKYFNKSGGEEALFQKALAINPVSAKARLGLALKKLRSKNEHPDDTAKVVKEAETDFKLFLELAPDLDLNAVVPEIRRLSDFEIYTMARKEIAQLNVPDGRAKVRPSPIIMAVDGVLSCLQSRSGESLKIIEDALRMAPGDPNILKAFAYLRWKESRYDDVIDLLKGNENLKNSFAANILLGKANDKNGNIDLAEKYYQALTVIAPYRSEGWALLGDVRMRQDVQSEAKKLFKISLDKDPNNLTAVKGLEQLGEDIVLSSPIYRKKLPF